MAQPFSADDSLEPSEADYWRQSRRPLTSLVFILPLLAIYEMGVLALGHQAMRNGADVWLRRLLDTLGFGQYFFLPVLIILVLLAWHHLTHEPWRISSGVVSGMYVESSVLGVALMFIAQLQGRLLGSLVAAVPNAPLLAVGPLAWLGKLVGFFGAGIYEEVLFRLLLLPLAIGALKACGLTPTARNLGAVVITSLLFSAAHYIGPQGDRWQLFSFVFRFLAGGFFAVLFVYRGFGIAAGTHALYDIFVGLF